MYFLSFLYFFHVVIEVVRDSIYRWVYVFKYRYIFYGSGCRRSARSFGPGVGGADIGLPSLNTS